MRYRKLASNITEEEIEFILYLVNPEAQIRKFQRCEEENIIRVFFELPYENPYIRLDILPDDLYLVLSGHEAEERHIEDGDITYEYERFSIARGFSEYLKANPYFKKSNP